MEANDDYSKDILADWKVKRFIVVDPGLREGSGLGVSIVLTDISYWFEQEAELDAWCEQYAARRSGMVIDMSESALMMFSLRWS